MAIPVRAVYEGGQLRLLDPVDLKEGEQVQVIIEQELTREEAERRLRAAGLLAEIELDDEDDDLAPLSEEERQRIGKLIVSYKSIQELIDEEREERI